MTLSDGTVVHLHPGTQGQTIAIRDLRAGDEVVVGVPVGSAVTVAPSGTAVSALPGQALGVIEGDHLYVARRPKAP